MAKKSTKKKTEIQPTESEVLKKMDALGKVASKQELDEAIESNHELTKEIESISNRQNLRWRCDCGLINAHNGTQAQSCSRCSFTYPTSSLSYFQ